MDCQTRVEDLKIGMVLCIDGDKVTIRSIKKANISNIDGDTYIINNTHYFGTEEYVELW